MTAAPKLGSLWKLYGRDSLVCRTCFPWREADVLGEEMGKGTRGTRRGMGPSAYARIAEIMSGRTISQQGLATTCEDLSYKVEIGGRDLVWRMSPYELRRRGNALRGSAGRYPGGGNARAGQRGSGHLAVPVLGQ
ncbi:MAG: hypothetical protein GTO12_06265 [Proteobacteria bacterium]|nr:hypothetical protein [Pseudomonadota bacterium]